MKLQTSAPSSGPSSAIGIMRFTDAEAGGPKMDPRAVLVFCVIFSFAILYVNLVA